VIVRQETSFGIRGAFLCVLSSDATSALYTSHSAAVLSSDSTARGCIYVRAIQEPCVDFGKAPVATHFEVEYSPPPSPPRLIVSFDPLVGHLYDI
jgi:hypothetical protein